MCGGGAPRATVVEPNYRAYDQMANMQLEAIRAQQNSGLIKTQQKLQSEQRAQEQTAMQLRDLRIQRANDTAANTARLAAILGPPPPSKAAKAPVVGDRRQPDAVRRDRDSLRIDRNPTASAPGAGLNIA